MISLSGNALKLIAAFFMMVDHVGLLFFPEVSLFRILGRLSFPIFAYLIAEGCRYTRSRSRYFLSIFSLAVGCQAVYAFFGDWQYLSVLFTFSLSILTIYAMDRFKADRSAKNEVMLTITIAGVFLLNNLFIIDYGFWGCMLPVCAAIFQDTSWDQKTAHLVLFGIGLVMLSLSTGGIQWWCLLTLPLLLCYSGQRGKGNLKYFFYLFYPLHLALLQGLQWLLQG